jgi:hypothetical protein
MCSLFADGQVSVIAINKLCSANKGTPDRDTKETTYYTDIKSESLREVLRTVLQRVDVISMNKAKLSVTYPSPQRNS